ncbi:SNF2-related [Macleaya cordata]|uniref:SNF2-related n=1 Tax=Macleaya cordata TaxID=56857 RepID=A0A200QTL7_MACCD|nr:SNF2-related [Macleaya cordata]
MADPVEDDPSSSSLKKFGSLEGIFKFFASSTSENKNKGSSRRWEALEPPKEIIKTELFMHKKLGLGWLIHRENPDELPPFWVENKKQGSYKNLLTRDKTIERPEPLRGGVFADDMGFVLNTSNIDMNLEINLEDEEEEEEEYLSLFVGGKRYYKKGKQSNKEIVGSHKKRKKDEIDSTRLLKEDEINPSSNVGNPRRTTLIVCPRSVLSMWTTQLYEHIRPGMLKVFMHYEIPRTNEIKIEELQKYDIVLTTLDSLVTEYRSSSITPSSIMNMEWFRVILDEAHMVSSCRVFHDFFALLALKSKSRWVVTGLPIMNGSYDLHFFMSFLRFEPFSDKHYWRTLVQLPVEKGNRNGLSRLQDLMATISLRRLKGDGLVGPPSKTVETCFVEFSVDERVKYDQKEVDTQDVVRNYVCLGRVVAPYPCIFAIIQRLRQMCNDMSSCPSEALQSYNIEDVSKNPELLRKMVSAQDGDYCDCPICYSPLSNTIITCCGHIFCKNCILKALSRKNPCCPMCRYRLSKSDLFSAPPEEPCNNDEIEMAIPSSSPGSGGTAYSSKVSALLKLLVASRNENPSVKSVVFSQFTKMLILLVEPLKAAGFGILRIDGLMSAKGKADDVIKEFKNQDSNSPATVLLLDVKASENGIDLTAASRVYLLEPWLNPAVEKQALDQVHCIGREEDVKIVRLITRNSIEERILELHERRKNLDFGKNMNQRQIRNEELRIIMSL